MSCNLDIDSNIFITKCFVGESMSSVFGFHFCYTAVSSEFGKRELFFYRITVYRFLEIGSM